MNLILMGTNDFVVPVFESLSQKHKILGVFTRAPKPMGRKHIITKSPIHIWADAKGLQVYTSIKEFDKINEKPDLIIVVSYGVLLGDDVLKSAKCVNIHPSSLPKYRGPSPIKTAILNGDTDMDVCLMLMTPELDAGDILIKKNISIEENDTNAIMENKVANKAIEILDEYMEDVDKYTAIAQVGTPSFTKKFDGTDEIIDWKQSARQIHNQIRALGCGRTKINGIDVKIMETTIKDDNLNIVKIQPAGKNIMDWKSFVNGLHGQEIKFGE